MAHRSSTLNGRRFRGIEVPGSRCATLLLSRRPREKRAIVRWLVTERLLRCGKISSLPLEWLARGVCAARIEEPVPSFLRATLDATSPRRAPVALANSDSHE